MSKKTIWFVATRLAFVAVLALVPAISFADYYGGGDFQAKIGSLTSNLVNVLAPAAAILGLVYSSILAALGDESSKSRMILCIVASCVAFLAPLFIHWLQSFMGG